MFKNVKINCAVSVKWNHTKLEMILVATSYLWRQNYLILRRLNDYCVTFTTSGLARCLFFLSMTCKNAGFCIIMNNNLSNLFTILIFWYIMSFLVVFVGTGARLSCTRMWAARCVWTNQLGSKPKLRPARPTNQTATHRWRKWRRMGCGWDFGDCF